MAHTFNCDEIKSCVKISQYLEDKGVRRHGSRAVASWRGGKNPNVAFNDERGTWCDFKTGEYGDIFSLFEKIEGGDFATAIKTLGERYGVPHGGTSAPATRRHTHRSRPAESPAEPLAEEHRQFVPVILRNYSRTTAFTSTATRDAFSETISMTDADLHLDEAAYRVQAAQQLRALFRPGDLIWAGWIIKDESVRSRLGYRCPKTPLKPWRDLFSDRDAFALGIRGIFNAFALADAIENGIIAKIPPSVSLNPVTGRPDEYGKYDTAKTIAAYRHALIEWDELFSIDADGVKIPSQDHIDIAAGLTDYAFEHPEKLRLASATYTGKKSIHLALRVNADNLGAYKRQTAALSDLFRSADDETFRADDQAGWNNGYTHIRLAGAIRPETGRRARLLWIGK